MPYVNIKIAKDDASTEQKAKLIEGAKQLLADVLGEDPDTTMIVIEEVDTDNFDIITEK